MDFAQYLNDPRLYSDFIMRHLRMADDNLRATSVAETPDITAETQSVSAAVAQAQATMALVVAVKDLTIAVRGIKEEK